MGYKLIKLTDEYKEELISMIEEWKSDQEINHTNRSPWAIFKNDCQDFDNYIASLDSWPNDGVPHVPTTTLFLLEKNATDY